jgi:hypothetical protein
MQKTKQKIRQTAIIALLLPASVWAQECVIQQKTVTNQTSVIIKQTNDIKRDVIPWGSNQKKCIVNFKALIDNNWHMASGEYVWDGDQPVSEACGVATARAKKDLTQTVKPANIVNEDVVICRDDTNQTDIRVTQVGNLVDIAQLKPHPDYPNKFYHNGAECRWFLDIGWTGKDIRQYRGIACKLEAGKWVVVDKF